MYWPKVSKNQCMLTWKQQKTIWKRRPPDRAAQDWNTKAVWSSKEVGGCCSIPNHELPWHDWLAEKDVKADVLSHLSEAYNQVSVHCSSWSSNSNCSYTISRNPFLEDLHSMILQKNSAFLITITTVGHLYLMTLNTSLLHVLYVHVIKCCTRKHLASYNHCLLMMPPGPISPWISSLISHRIWKCTRFAGL